MSGTTFIVNGENIFAKIERLQAENELLKDANAHLKTELKQRYDEPDFESFRLMGKTIDEWKQLEVENERLKEEIKKEKEIYKENVHYLACMTSQRNKLKLALEEIREINKKWLSRWLNDPDERYGFEEIKSKINEVLNERN